MNKFLAVVRHEYKKVVLKWAFLIGTLLFPVLGIGFAVVPALIFSIEGEETRLVVVDPTGKILPRLKAALSPDVLREKARAAAREQLTSVGASQEEKLQNSAEQFASSFSFVEYDPAGQSIDQVRRELNEKASANEIDAYLLIPAETSGRYEFRSRRAADFVASKTLRDALNHAVRSQRLADASIDEIQLSAISRNVDLESKAINDQGEEKDTEMLFLVSLAIAMMIYITLTIYGQVIMGAVVEEKETRLAEILFSSARPYTLMFGKLVGVGLAGLTQLGIWTASIAAVVGYLASRADTAELFATLPQITPLMVIYFFIFFILGYFIYASMFALVGSMVTTVQEGGQFAFPPIMIMLIAFYFCFAVIRDPNSTLSFWVSIAPLFAPITMPVRILAEMPPFWHIGLAILLNAATIASIVWVAARVYRVGMLMYGKRATIPEVLKWIGQA